MTHLIIGVVGHTNTGKTSLIRTLLRKKSFGHVLDQPGTTRHVESATIAVDEHNALELRDTPGLEDASALKQHLLNLGQPAQRPRTLLDQCISNAEKTPEYAQEIKVVKQSLQCDILMYVIDCREPVFEKYLDEIAILQMSATPILPVLNFISDENQFLNEWQTTLADLGLHALVRFDTVAYNFESEKRLYQKMQTLIEAHFELLQKLIHQRQVDWINLQATACKRVAHLLFDACNIEIDHTPESMAILQQTIRELEQTALTEILQLMQFSEHDVAMTELPVSQGQWRYDLTSSETLKILGMDTASAAATGAAIGAGIDLIFAGLSLGAATATGAALGTAWNTGKRFGKPMYTKLFGSTSIKIDTATLDLLARRQLWLLTTLFHRGHAAQDVAKENKKHRAIPQNWPIVRQKILNSVGGIGLKEQEMLTQLQEFLFNATNHADLKT